MKSKEFAAVLTGSGKNIEILLFFYYNSFMRNRNRKRKWLLAAVTALAAGMFVCVCAVSSCKRQARPGAKPPPTGPNVLLISIDTLRPDHLGCYGYHRKTSPRIDKLAAGGVLFENHISSTSWTLPAHAALFTSLADSVHGCLETNKNFTTAW